MDKLNLYILLTNPVFTMDQRLSGSKDGVNNDFIPFPSTPVTFIDMDVILAPIRQKLDNIKGVVTKAMDAYDPNTRKAGTIPAALHSLSKAVNGTNRKLDTVKSMTDEYDIHLEIEDIQRKIRYLHEDVTYQNDLLKTIAADIEIIKRSKKRERDIEIDQHFGQPLGQPSASFYGWPVGSAFDSSIYQPRDDAPRINRDYYDGRDYSHKQRK